MEKWVILAWLIPCLKDGKTASPPRPFKFKTI
jgi:hypothetical protein